MQFGLGYAAMGPVQHGVIAMFGSAGDIVQMGPMVCPPRSRLSDLRKIGCSTIAPKATIESVDRFKRGVFDSLIRAP